MFTIVLQNRDVRTLLPLTLKQLSSASTTGESNFSIDGVDINTVSSFFLLLQLNLFADINTVSSIVSSILALVLSVYRLPLLDGFLVWRTESLRSNLLLMTVQAGLIVSDGSYLYTNAN